MNGGVTARPGSMTAAEFITARLADDEARVRALPPGPWFTVSDPEAPEPWYMMTGHSPERVLRQVTAMRAILEAHRSYEEIDRRTHRCFVCASVHAYKSGAAIQELWPCPTLRHLAAVWADHPQYDESWQP